MCEGGVWARRGCRGLHALAPPARGSSASPPASAAPPSARAKPRPPTPPTPDSTDRAPPVGRYEPLFDSLRTKQQLGYTVGCSSRGTYGQLGFVIRVVSATHGAAHCEAAAADFLRAFADDVLGKMSADAYAQRGSRGAHRGARVRAASRMPRLRPCGPAPL